MRIIISSKIPPTEPAIAPRSVPTTIAKNTVISAELNEIRIPYIVLLNISLPSSSVPKIWAALGACSAISGCVALIASSGYGESIGANIALKIKRSSTIMEILVNRFLFSR